MNGFYSEGAGVADNRDGTPQEMGDACTEFNIKRPENPDRRWRPLMALSQFVVWMVIGVVIVGLICILPIVLTWPAS